MNYLTQDFKPLSMKDSSNSSLLSAWGMPYICLGPWSPESEHVNNCEYDELVDPLSFEQTLQDLLEETDALFDVNVTPV